MSSDSKAVSTTSAVTSEQYTMPLPTAQPLQHSQHSSFQTISPGNSPLSIHRRLTTARAHSRKTDISEIATQLASLTLSNSQPLNDRAGVLASISSSKDQSLPTITVAAKSALSSPNNEDSDSPSPVSGLESTHMMVASSRTQSIRVLANLLTPTPYGEMFQAMALTQPQVCIQASTSNMLSPQQSPLSSPSVIGQSDSMVSGTILTQVMMSPRSLTLSATIPPPRSSSGSELGQTHSEVSGTTSARAMMSPQSLTLSPRLSSSGSELGQTDTMARATASVQVMMSPQSLTLSATMPPQQSNSGSGLNQLRSTAKTATSAQAIMSPQALTFSPMVSSSGSGLNQLRATGSTATAVLAQMSPQAFTLSAPTSPRLSASGSQLSQSRLLSSAPSTDQVVSPQTSRVSASATHHLFASTEATAFTSSSYAALLGSSVGGQTSTRSPAPSSPLFLTSPTTPVPPPSPTQSITSPVSTSKPRAKALLVDDESVNQRVGTKLLGSFGYDVVVASSGTEALTLMSSTAFDLILMDQIMPDKTGVTTLTEFYAGASLSTATQIQQTNARAATFVFSSTERSKITGLEALSKEHNVGFHEKPAKNPATLKAYIANLVQEARARQQ